MVKEWPVPFWYVDTGMAALCMLLTAVDEGLGACEERRRRKDDVVHRARW